MSPDGSWMGIAYQENIGLHPFEENEEQRYIKFVRGDMSASHSVISNSESDNLEMPFLNPCEIMASVRPDLC